MQYDQDRFWKAVPHWSTFSFRAYMVEVHALHLAVYVPALIPLYSNVRPGWPSPA